MKKQAVNKPAKKPIINMRFALLFLGTVLFGTLIIAISLHGLDQKEDTQYELAQYVAESSGDNPYFDMELASGTLKVNQENTLKIKLNSENHKIKSARLKLTYDKNKISIVQNNIEIVGDDFDKYQKQFTEGAISIYAWFNSPSSVYQNNEEFVNIKFTPLSTSNSQFTIVCDQSDITSSNAVDENAVNILDCSLSQNLSLTNIASETIEEEEEEEENNNNRGGGTELPKYTSKCHSQAVTNLKATSGPGYGQVHLTWDKASGADYYELVFGDTWEPNDYGQPNIGNTDQYVVNGLQAGKLYYFVILAHDGDCYVSEKVGVSAYGGYSTYSSSSSSTTNTTTTNYDSDWGSQTPVVADDYYDDYYDDFWDEMETASDSSELEPTPSPTASPIVYDEEEIPEDESFMDYLRNQISKQLADPLPWIGLVGLLFLAVILILVVKRKSLDNQLE